MSLEEYELKIKELEQLAILQNDEKKTLEIYKKINALKIKAYTNLSAWDRVMIARSPSRPKSIDVINGIIDSFVELHGDRYYADDNSIIAGLGFLNELPVTIIAQAKGKNLEENIKRNFGMTSPEGFRKSLRLAKEAEKFNRPIITIVDTSGAYPGKGAEERGQAFAIANNLMEFCNFKVPVIAIVLSEGGSGGALALTVSDYIYMFENAIYSVLSPEGFASILFKDTSNVKEVASYMRLTSYDLKEFKIIDEIIDEPLGGITSISSEFAADLKEKIYNKILELKKLNIDDLTDHRYQKYRNIGVENGI